MNGLRKSCATIEKNLSFSAFRFKSYSFLNAALIPDYDILNKLFFQVLAKKVADRTDKVAIDFAKVPYLNSSLFEPTDLEHKTLIISNLENNLSLPLLNATVIKNSQGKKAAGTKNALDYFFSFLDSYDFASEGSEDIQEDNKTLINASVLGLIFEKINGYKDGSFFTPSFITMYMCKETIRRAVVTKFNEVKQWTCETFDDLKNKDFTIIEANKIVNAIKICDPAVGSGHFLVSALNEIIAIKHELQILADKQHLRLKNYNFEVVNDELIVTDKEGIPFVYYPKDAESQRVQETLFHEKQTIIENCLFGVDINPNSVKICRLRLWIELLKNAYYVSTDKSRLVPTLETLPNIDINIKCGNSLISRFALDADLKKALKQSKWNIESYKLAVTTYQNAETKEQKREMERLIDEIKGNFVSEIAVNDPKKLKYEKLKGELFNYTQQVGLFEYGKKEQAIWNKKVNILAAEVKQLDTELEDIKSNKIYQNAFEWRFEFPQVLDDDGDFIGFDVVIGNPPYLFVENKTNEGKFYNNIYKYQQGKLDLYRLFIERSHEIIKINGLSSLIIPISILNIPACTKLRQFIINHNSILDIVNFYGSIFDEANVNTLILNTKKCIDLDFVNIVEDETEFPDKNSLSLSFKKLKKINTINWKQDPQFSFKIKLENQDFNVINKVELFDKKLKDSCKYTLGLQVYHNSIHNQGQIKNRIFHNKIEIDETYFPEIGGSNISRYFSENKFKEFVSFGEWCYNKPTEKFCRNKRIYIREILSNKGLIASFIKESNIPNKSLIVVLPNDENELFLILGILNSKLIKYYIEKTTEKGTQKLFPRVSLTTISNLPLPDFSKNNQQPFIDKVNEILTLKKENSQADTSSLENAIDVMIYELYGLSEEEIKVVEG